MGDVDRFRGISGRGSIATGAAILLLIPSACRVRDSNGVKTSNQIAAVTRYETEFEALKRKQYRIQAAIAGVGADIQAIERRRDAAVAKLLPASTELGEKLRLVKRMEEDLVAAKKRQAAIGTQLAAIAALEKKVAAASSLSAKVTTVDAQIAAQEKLLKRRTAVLVGLRQTLADLAALEARIKKQVVGAPAKAPPKKAPPKKASPKK
jgi:septal ring factor EnvC (AmiA/AmiB activator)